MSSCSLCRTSHDGQPHKMAATSSQQCVCVRVLSVGVPHTMHSIIIPNCIQSFSINYYV